LFVARQTVIAYWLIPAQPAHSFLQRIIEDLARRYDAPVFEPHVTIHVGANRTDLAEAALTHTARKGKRTWLTPVRIDESDEFIKTLFVEFAPSEELREMNAIIRNAAQDSLQYELKPHLSLLYKKMEAAIRRDLAASMVAPCYEIGFDTIKAVRCVSPTQSRADVVAWRVLAAEPLPG
jgi:2'-5' RNA ligase